MSDGGKPDSKLEAARLRVFGTNRLHWSMPATTATVLGAYLWCASPATHSDHRPAKPALSLQYGTVRSHNTENVPHRRYVYYVERPRDRRLAAENPALASLLAPAPLPDGVVKLLPDGRQLMEDGSIRKPDSQAHSRHIR
jgi:hypothetical protein